MIVIRRNPFHLPRLPQWQGSPSGYTAPNQPSWMMANALLQFGPHSHFSFPDGSFRGKSEAVHETQHDNMQSATLRRDNSQLPKAVKMATLELPGWNLFGHDG